MKEKVTNVSKEMKKYGIDAKRRWFVHTHPPLSSFIFSSFREKQTHF
jgi:hypothetical protein